MSSNQDISARLATGDGVDGDGSAIDESILSVRLQASKFQRITNKDNGKITSLLNKYQNQTAAQTNTYRSLSNKSKHSSSRDDDAIFSTGSKKVEQALHSSKNTGDTHEKPNIKYRYYNEQKMSSAKTDNQSNRYEEDLDSSMTDEEGDDDDDHCTGDSADSIKNEKSNSINGNNNNNNNTDRPKPGRLDLRQFDNITSAIAKLNVKPLPESRSRKSSNTPTTAKSSANISSWKSTKDQTNIKKQSETYRVLSNDPDLSYAANPRRQLQNPRKNHGRPVAPPRLPSSQAVAASAPTFSSTERASAFVLAPRYNGSINKPDDHDFSHSKDRADFEISKGVLRATVSDESPVDLNQSPIAQRFLKYPKDYKVCELSSPYASDNDLTSTPYKATTRVLPRGRDLFKDAHNLSNSSTNIHSYYRAHSSEPRELISSRGETIRQLNEMLAKPPPVGGSLASKNLVQHNAHLMMDPQQQFMLVPGSKKSEKEGKKDKKRDDKLEKRKLKEEKLRKQEEEKLRRQEKKLASRKSKVDGHTCIDDDGIPLFIRRCIEFIEAEGLDAEGIYRVPGNRAHVDTLVQKFRDNPQMSILESDIPVNAVATALKDFLSKKLGPIIPATLMSELTELANLPDKEHRVEEVRNLVKRLPSTNYNILKYVFSHFVKVSLNSSLNSMDSKNLAICWWPTLLPLQFNDMVMFEQMRPHLEESVQTLIDRYDFIFDCDETSTMYH